MRKKSTSRAKKPRRNFARLSLRKFFLHARFKPSVKAQIFIQRRRIETVAELLDVSLLHESRYTVRVLESLRTALAKHGFETERHKFLMSYI